ncbi:BEL1-like homeodomain protein 7 [Impatiens glandulifera]|uniref:BEL1-like homeodomain protein 7 n=1 Tax=Impatiens glandulifera TaxID=253017 RepID=UPI001FB16800|nr:BEL1-like homeodomain protein 7 [Impatiens glandulifera]
MQNKQGRKKKMASYFPSIKDEELLSATYLQNDQESGSNPDNNNNNNNNNIMYLNQESVNVPYMELLSTARRDDDLLELIPSSSSSSSLNLQSDFVHLQITDNSQNFQSQALSLTLGNQMQPPYLSPFGGNYIYDSEMTTPTLNCNSKYLKPAQELLDEVVSVWNSPKPSSSSKKSIIDDLKSSSNLLPPTNNNEKMSKLLTMLEELDGRYRQYQHQMQVLASSFETMAGFCSSKPYTTLALQTISRQFRCLRDAINNQIRVIQRSMGEDEQSSSSQGRLTRLRNLELQIRQQKAVQQFGLMRHSWRPQRGLPETSVSILRAWLFEHFLHPYPKDSEKIMLARQTGLTRGQVANWFINARVRLWKPMVEEMYTEEFSEDSKTLLPENADEEYLNATENYGAMKQQNNYNPPHVVVNNERNLLLTDSSTFDASDTTYDIGELGNLIVENRVSLALGLQHSEIGGGGGGNLPESSSSSGGRMPLEITNYGGMEDHHDQLNQQNRIMAISTQMLPDFTS